MSWHGDNSFSIGRPSSNYGLPGQSGSYWTNSANVKIVFILMGITKNKTLKK